MKAASASSQQLILILLVVITLVNLLLLFNFFSKNTPQIAPAPVNTGFLILSPANGTNLAGNAAITLAYPAGRGFVQVEVFVDGARVQTLNPKGPYEITLALDTGEYTDGSHILSFETTDTAGQKNKGQVSVNFENGR